MARIVLLILCSFSLFSWALIFQKLRLFGRLNRQTAAFVRTFRAARGLPEPRTLGLQGSPLEQVYAAGYRELASQLLASNPHPKVKSLHAVSADMQATAADEVRKLESYMPWLATTGSVTPFIGLFGTVWGVMDAFSGLGTAGAASLRVELLRESPKRSSLPLRGYSRPFRRSLLTTTSCTASARWPRGWTTSQRRLRR